MTNTDADTQATLDAAVLSPSEGRLPTEEASQRSFAIVTGYVFNAVGLALILSTCCLLLFSGWIIAPWDSPVDRWVELLSPQRLSATLTGTALIVSFVVGTGLIATGVGLQGEKPSSAAPAMFVAGVLAGVHGAIVVLAGVQGGAWAVAGCSAVLVVVGTVLFLLAGHSRAILRQFPPPEDQNIVSDEWIANYRDERRRKMTVYPSADRWDEFER